MSTTTETLSPTKKERKKIATKVLKGAVVYKLVYTSGTKPHGPLPPAVLYVPWKEV